MTRKQETTKAAMTVNVIVATSCTALALGITSCRKPSDEHSETKGTQQPTPASKPTLPLNPSEITNSGNSLSGQGSRSTFLPALSQKERQQQVFAEPRLREAVEAICGGTNDAVLAEVHTLLDYGEQAKAFKPEQVARALAVLSLAASHAPATVTFSIATITPPTQQPDIIAVIDDAFREQQKKGVGVSGDFKLGGMGGKFIGMLVAPSGLLSESIKVATGLYLSKAEMPPTRNIRAYATVMSITEKPTGSGSWVVTRDFNPVAPPGSRKHLFQSNLPDECLLLDENLQLQFPVGAGSRYRFVGTSAEAFDGYVFIGTDRDFPLTFVLLPSRGLTYLHGRGAVYRNGATVATFPSQ